jgi:DNA-binding beta-propeller fold protein YncE
MKKLSCEMCGSIDLIKQDGVFVCQSCGAKYSVEEAKKMMVECSAEASDNPAKIDNKAVNYAKSGGTAKKKKILSIVLATAVIVTAIFLIVTKIVIPSSVKVGDYITFGSYEQDNDTSNGPEAIEWLVLDKQDDKILVISKYGLDAKPYNKEYTDITWEKCTLRSWLNDDFYNAAFNADEKKTIVQTEVSADKNPEYSTNPGNDTTDNVFLLSITEVNKYFSSDSTRQCAATDYAIEQGAWTSSEYTVDGKATFCWWLRSPGGNQGHAAYVYFAGSVYHYGDFVSHDDACVRPALWINLEA